MMAHVGVRKTGAVHANATSAPLNGICDARFSPVGDAFAANFTERDEVGAAVCVIADGRTVVDLWGGHADAGRHRPWEQDTLVNVFSLGKALAALCVARLGGAAALDVDRPVAALWPEFGAAGKETVTVREVLAHRAGLPAVREPLADDVIYDPALMTAALAAQAPWWEPGTAHGYHPNTFGFLVGEIVARVAGRSLGTYLREEITGPLDADVHIGLPDPEHGRVAEFLWPSGTAADQVAGPLDFGAMTDLELMRFQGYFNPAGVSGYGIVNTPEWRRAEIPSTNGHGTARALARVFAALVAGGSLDGVRVVDGGALADAVVEQSNGDDLVLDRHSRFGTGFQLTQPERPLGPNPSAFGHFGAGGSLAYCDPDAGVAFCYVMNQMGPRWQNPSNEALVGAVYSALE